MGTVTSYNLPTMNLIIIILVLIIVIAESCAMSCVTYSTQSTPAAWLTMGVLFYALVVLCLRETFKIKEMGAVNGLWSALSVISIASVGVFWFGEKLTSAELVAICLSAVAAGIIGK